jgi:hypothetical protein
MDSDFKEVLEEQALDSKGPPSVLGWDEGRRFIEEAIQKVVLRQADVAEELAAANQKVQKQIRQSGRFK